MMMGPHASFPLSPLGLFLGIGDVELLHLEVQCKGPELVLVNK